MSSAGPCTHTHTHSLSLSLAFSLPLSLYHPHKHTYSLSRLKFSLTSHMFSFCRRSLPSSIGHWKSHRRAAYSRKRFPYSLSRTPFSSTSICAYLSILQIPLHIHATNFPHIHSHDHHNTLQHTANTLQHTATHTTPHCHTLSYTKSY